MRATVCLFTALLLVPTASAFDDAIPVAKLVAALSSPDFREREAAFRALDRRGASALGELRTAARTGDAETRRRAAELVDRIGRRQAAARVLTPTLVSLNYDKTALADAIADLSRRTGGLVTLHGDPARLRGRTVTVVSDNATFWQAVQLFAHRAGLREWDGVTRLPPALETAGSESDVLPGEGVQILGQMNIRRGQVGALTVPVPITRIALVDGPGREPVTHICGAVRVRALPPGAPFAADAGKDQLVVLAVSAEPRLRIDGATDLRLDRVIDADGRTREARPLWAEPQVDYDDWRGPRLPREITERKCGPVGVRLPVEDGATKRLRELAGVVTVRAFPTERAVEIARPAEAVKRTSRARDIAVTLLSVGEVASGEVRVAAEVQLPYGVRLDTPLAGPVAMNLRNFGRGWGGLQLSDPEPTGLQGDEYQGLVLEDANGRRWPAATGITEIVGLFPQWFTVRVTGTFRPPAPKVEPARVAFIVRRPTAVDVPFTLRDVPLP